MHVSWQKGIEDVIKIMDLRIFYFWGSPGESNYSHELLKAQNFLRLESEIRGRRKEESESFEEREAADPQILEGVTRKKPPKT